MPRQPSRPPELVGRVFRTQDVLRAGLLTRRQLQGPAWRPLLRGVHADSRLEVHHGTLCRAAQLICPAGTLLAGRSAAWVLGADLVDPSDPWDLARAADRVTAVVALDVLPHGGVVDHDRLRRYAEEREGPGSARARRAIALADGRAASPPETRVRLALVLSGLPAPVPQHEVWSGGGFVARVDLAWPDRRVAVEYDGAGHADPTRMRRDRHRLNRLLAA